MFLSKYIRPVVVAIGLSAASISSIQAEDFTKAEIEEIVHQYILENPELIAEVIIKLQQQAQQERAEQEAKQQAMLLEQAGDKLFNNASDPVGGNPEGTITIVEFFDYNCGYCKRANDTLQQLIAQNDDLRVVYKEWPILSESSATAANIALAVNLAFPGQYETFHRALLDSRSLRSEDAIWAIVEKLELSRDAIEAKLDDPGIQAHLSDSLGLARQLGITGTPAFIVGGQILKGAYPLEQIQKAIDDAREG